MNHGHAAGSTRIPRLPPASGRVTLAPMRSVVLASLALLVTSLRPAGAWGPQVHAMLGGEGASRAGLDAAGRVACASGSLLADLDHTLANPLPVGDSPGFARALVAVRGRTGASDHWARGWLAHALAQDPQQGEISARDHKLLADMIAVRTAGFHVGGAVLDPGRIRAAVLDLGGRPVAERDIVAAAARLVVLAIFEGALVEMVPLDLDDPVGDLPPARTLMPAELAHYPRRAAASLDATVQVLLGGGRVARTRRAVAAAAGPDDVHPLGDIPVPPAALLGLEVRTRTVAGGLVTVTVRLVRPLVFRAVARIALDRLGRRVFPAAAARWDSGARVRQTAEALGRHLAAREAEIVRLFGR